MATVAPVILDSSCTSMSSSVSGESSKSTISSRVKGKPGRNSTDRKTPTESRPVRQNSDEGLSEMALFDGDASLKILDGPVNNRQRVAKMAKMNASYGSLDYTNRSDNAEEAEGGTSSRRKVKRITYYSRRPRSSSPVLDEEDGVTVTSAATSNSRRGRRGGLGRSGRRRRSTSANSTRSGGRGAPQRSKSSATGSKPRRPPLKSASGENLIRPRPDETRPRSSSNPRPDQTEEGSRTESRSSRRPRRSRGDSGTLPPKSDSKSPRRARRYSNRMSESDLLDPPLSAKSDSGVSPRASKKFSEEEIMSFLRAQGKGEIEELLHQSGILSLEELKQEDAPTSRRERASQSQRDRNRDHDSEKPRSQRRERTVGGAVSSSVRGEGNGRRTPRSRGVSRSHSDAPVAVATEEQGESPRSANPKPPRSRRKPPSERGVRRNRSADSVDLGSFLATSTATVSRRKKPSSGNRSVASMPTRPRRRRPGTPASTSYDDEDNHNRNKPRSNRTAATYPMRYEEEKPPSGRTTVTDPLRYGSSSDDDQNSFGGDSFGGDSFEGDLGGESSGKKGLDFTFHQSFANVETALQMHMNRTENLLFDVFPKHIAEALRAGKKVEPENHPCVTIFFSDIVGFTNISSTLDPLKVSDMLDRLYNSFDALSHYHDVFKVETIGDAYVSPTPIALYEF